MRSRSFRSARQPAPATPSIALALCLVAGISWTDPPSPFSTHANGDLHFVDTVAISSPDLELSYVTSLATDSRGRIYLADAGRQTVVILNPDARHLRNLGRRGSGPGEFATVSSVEILPDDTLLVYDVQLARMAVFEPSAWALTRTVSVLAGGGGHPMWVSPAAKGGFLAGYVKPFVAGAPSATDLDRRVVVGQLDATGRRLRDSLVVVRGTSPLLVRQGGSVSSTTNPFGRTAIFRAHAGQLYYVSTDSAAVQIYSATGQAIATVGVKVKPIRLAQETVDSAAALHKQPFRDALREAAPKTWPPIRDVQVDDQGRIWVGTVLTPAVSVRWVVLNDSGVELDHLVLPWNFRMMSVRNGLIYGLVTDEDEVPRVVVLRRSK